jgi:transcriptional regulator GlxA family with amidase domain
MQQFAFVLFQGFDAQDITGPYEILQHVPDVAIDFYAAKPGLIRNEHGKFQLNAERSFDALASADLILVPGGSGERQARHDQALLEQLRAAQARDAWLVSVCTGALVLGAAGVLRGKRATTHWLATEELTALGATTVPERYCFDGKLVSSAGVSAGIDMALALAARIAGPIVAQAIQLGIEYDPQPPFQTGSPEKSPEELVKLLRARSRFNRAA